MGTPSFAATLLARLALREDVDLRGVWCRPDRPAGRGKKLSMPAVKTAALALNLPVFQPERFTRQEDIAALAAFEPDVLVVAAYGLILPRPVLDIPRLAPINVHASLLPHYRGAAPIQRAIMDGCARTGVSIMRMEAGLDTGPVYASRSVEIGEHTAGSLHDELARIGGDLLIKTLVRLAAGTARAVPQNEAEATYASKIGKTEKRIDWNVPLRTVHARIRGLTPRPGASAVLRLPARAPGEAQRETAVTLAPGSPGGTLPYALPPGSLWATDGGLCVACTDSLYALGSLRPADRAFMSAADFMRGFLAPGTTGLCGCAL